MSDKSKTYQSYILRFWHESEESWRARLEPISGRTKPRHFANPESLIAFLSSPVFERESEAEKT